MVKNCEILGGFGVTWDLMSYKHVRCNLDVCPELMSRQYCSEGVANLIPHEDKVDVITPFNIGHRGWRILIPHEDKVDVFIPINVLFRGGGTF